MSDSQPFRYGIDTLDPTTALALAAGTLLGIIDQAAVQKIEKSLRQVAATRLKQKRPNRALT
jgi:hypothetical protein